MKCTTCGYENPFDAHVCANCGFALYDDAEAAFEANEQTIDAEAFHKQSQIDEIKRRRDMKRKKKKIRRIILVVLIIALCAGAVYGAFYLSRQNDISFDDNEVVQATQTPTPEPTVTPLSTPEPTIMPTPSEPTEQNEPQDMTDSDEALASVEVPERTSTPSASDSSASNKMSSGKNTSSVQGATEKVPATQNPVSKPTPKPTQKPTPKPTPTPELKSAVAVAGETITDEAGKQYSTIVTNGKIYYLEVSTPLENNAYAVVSGKATGKKINNLPVYAPSSVSDVSKSEFILPDSSVRLLTQEDLAGLNTDQLKIARNEIYARSGRKFSESALNSYFSSKSWYKVNPEYKYSNDALNISDIEDKNAHMLLEAEKALYSQQTQSAVQQ